MDATTIIWIVIAAIVVAHVALFITFRIKRDSNANDEVTLSKIQQTELLVHSMFGVIYLIFIVGSITNALGPDRGFLINLSVSIVISWLIILVGYYAWAIYFYNINLGWSDEKWQRFRTKPANDQTPPEENPYIDETFGLPPGTVRGTIALSLVVLAMALAITSLGLDNTLRSNTTLIDHFDFLKQAFIMMIAFYFGSKSLEILQNRPPVPSEHGKGENPPDANAQEAEKKKAAEAATRDFSDVMAEG